MPKMNRIIAKGVSGIYKDKDIEIQIGERSKDCHIFVEGKEILSCFGIHIHMRSNEPTKVIIEKYALGLKGEKE